MEKINQGYKQTDIGIIPGDWDVLNIRHLGRFSKGSGISRAESQTGEIPSIRYGEIYTTHNDYIKDFHSFISVSVAKNARKLKTGDLLFTASGETKEEIGKCVAFIDNIEAYAGGDILIISPENRFNSLLLGFLLNAPYVVKQKANKGQGDAVVHITKDALSDIVIALPKETSEQTAIATALSDVDALITALNKKITKKQQIKQGAMQQLLTGKKRLPGFSGNSGFKQTELGLIPEDWEVIELGEISANIGYGVGAAAISYDGENKYIRITDIDERTRKFSPSPLSSPTFFLDSFHVNEGDILFARTGASVGKSYLYNKNDGRLIFAGFLIRFNIVNAIPEYVYYHTFTRKYNEWILSESARTGQPGVNVEQLKSFQIPFPKDFAEQTAIAQVLTDMDDEIVHLEADRYKYYQIKAGMMQQLLTGKIRLIN